MDDRTMAEQCADALDNEGMDDRAEYVRLPHASHAALLKAAKEIDVWLINWDLPFDDDDSWPYAHVAFSDAIRAAESLEGEK